MKLRVSICKSLVQSVSSLLTGVLQSQGAQLCAGSFRSVGPNCIDQVVLHRHQRVACVHQCLGHVLPLVLNTIIKSFY